LCGGFTYGYDIGYAVQQKRIPDGTLENANGQRMNNQIKFLPIILVVSLLGIVGNGLFLLPVPRDPKQLSNPKESGRYGK